ncbi:hypothetical protein QQ020_10400 [Fulvivirgaceae bacterium BMA12]|uniref:Lipoprotein n=1 Tax=Agaribacillus aureus TaxID=3051825 RepID=A0ABT8L422_9BACT|nr:hypothetical protein [Fulvivirgaceae bacterium BMA12]
MMKFSVQHTWLVFLIVSLASGACNRSHEDEQIRKLIDKNLAMGPRTETTILSIKFGDSHVGYQKKMDSLYQAGIIRSLIPDSLMSGGLDLAHYKYYYVFEDREALEDIKWIFSPVFEHNRLIALSLITSSILDKPLGDRPLNPTKGILKNIIDTSEEVMADADITYRLTRAYLSDQYGSPEFVTEDGDKSYWFKGNCVISITNTATTIRILFKNSESK